LLEFVYKLELIDRSSRLDFVCFLNRCLTDPNALVRQVASSAGEVTLSKRYDPYGQVLDYEGSSNPSFGYAGEWGDKSIDWLLSIFLKPNFRSINERK